MKNPMNEEYLNAIIQSLQTGVLVIDATTHTILDANPLALALIGEPKERVIGQLCHTFICPAEVGKCPITDLKQEADTAERVLVNEKGEQIAILKSARAMNLGGRDLILETYIDISDRKALENYLTTVMDSLRTGVLVIDATTHMIRDANAFALSMIGAQKQEVIGQPCQKFICSADTPQCPITDLNKTIDNVEGVLTNQKGERIPILKSVRSISLGGRDLILETFIDIIDRKAMEERNARLIQELETANNELNDFAHVVSHDLKAPLRAIGSLSQWLAADYRDKLDAEGKAQLDLLVSRVNRMQNLIDGILEYSRVGRLREEMERIDLNGIVREAIESLAPPETIRITVDTPLPAILFEKTRIRQVFSNLIGNAIKYMDKPAGEIHIGCTRDNGAWRFYVMDNGPGIDVKYYDKIFQIFQTLHPRDQVESTGIGLSIVKKIVEQHKGHIWVESRVPEGSIFYFTLPITEVTDGESP